MEPLYSYTLFTLFLLFVRKYLYLVLFTSGIPPFKRGASIGEHNICPLR